MKHSKVTVDVYEFEGKQLIVFPYGNTAGTRMVVPVLTYIEHTDTLEFAGTDITNTSIMKMYRYLYKTAIRELLNRIEKVLTCS